jgi:hypothetical protein
LIFRVDFSQFSRNIEHLCFKRLDFQFSAPIHVTSNIHDSEIVHTIKSEIPEKQSKELKTVFLFGDFIPVARPVNLENTAKRITLCAQYNDPKDDPRQPC